MRGQCREPSSSHRDGAVFVDCALQYSGAPASHFSGAEHLAGQLCKVLADGSPHPDVTVAGDGSFDLNAEYENVLRW